MKGGLGDCQGYIPPSVSMGSDVKQIERSHECKPSSGPSTQGFFTWCPQSPKGLVDKNVGALETLLGEKPSIFINL